MKNIILILILLLFQKCAINIDQPDLNEVFIHKFDITSKELRTIDTSYLVTSTNGTSTKYFYRTNNYNDSTFIYYFFEKFHDQDSITILYSDSCKYIDSKTYEVENQKFEIQSYYYDREKFEDEETTIYFSDKYGLLLLFNEGWITINGIIIYDEISKKLVEMIINDSTNDFPSWRKVYLKKLLVPKSHNSP